jgi:hypothetical protein
VAEALFASSGIRESKADVFGRSCCEFDPACKHLNKLNSETLWSHRLGIDDLHGRQADNGSIVVHDFGGLDIIHLALEGIDLELELGASGLNERASRRRCILEVVGLTAAAATFDISQEQLCLEWLLEPNNQFSAFFLEEVSTWILAVGTSSSTLVEGAAPAVMSGLSRGIMALKDSTFWWVGGAMWRGAVVRRRTRATDLVWRRATMSTAVTWLARMWDRWHSMAVRRRGSTKVVRMSAMTMGRRRKWGR